MINHHIPSSQRATILSVDSLFSELGSGIGQSGWGYLARRQGIGQAWVAAGAFLVLGIPLLLLARRADPESDRFGAPVPTPGAVAREHRRPPAVARGHAHLRVHRHRGLDPPRAGAGRGALQRRARRSRPPRRGARSTPRAGTGCAWRATPSSTCSSAPTAAIAAVAAAQRALAAHVFPDNAVIRVRMGLHTGEASLGSEATGADYVGYDVHRAARIASAGHGGQVLLSEPVSLLVRDALPAGVTLRELGEHRFKDLGRPERVLQLVIDGLPADFPPIRSLNAVPNNLPMQVTSFVGREREIAEGVKLFQQARVLTLTGPGGTGKTRLSLQIAAQVAHQFPGGVTFVALAPISDPELVAPAIVEAMHLEAGSAPPRDRLLQHFRDRQALLVMDNFEQVLAAATLVADLIRACPGLKVIASSRGPLRISGEQEMPVPPLALPDPGAPAERVSQYEAVRLFIERAVAVKPGFAVTNENAPAVAEICARLDGLPLAIELAAARIKLLPPAAILTRLQSRLGLLQSSARDLPDRQKTLRGAIAWSHDLLDEPGRRLFARLAVFAGGGELDDVEAICGGDDLGIDVLDGLEALVDQSLVRQEEHDGEARAIMLETIREFALEQLAAEPRRGGGAQPSRAPFSRARRGGRAAPLTCPAARLARPPGARARQPARGAGFLRRIGAHRRGAAPGSRALAFLADPRSPARGSAAGQARARRSRRRAPTRWRARRRWRRRAASPTGSGR